MLRKTIFWIHLCCGVVTGLVIVMMSVTGVLLTYERQMLEWADAGSHARIEPGNRQRQSIESLLAAARLQEPNFEPTSLAITNDPQAAVTLGAGRGGDSFLVDPYTGEMLGEGATGMREFFSAVTGWHRWFNAGRESRAPWRAVTGISNLAFLFLLLSGLYLWLPRVSKWAAFRMHLWFNPKATNAKARDYNWHHVFGFWTAIPLIVIVYTATVFNYSWSNDLLYRAFGEEPPSGGRQAAAAVAHAHAAEQAGVRISLDELLSRAQAYTEDWRRITLQLPEAGAADVRFTIDRGTGGQPQHRHTLVLDAASAAVAAWEPFSSQSPGRQARSWVRFLHTGEAFGFVGQTVAGVVSATTVLMVWTGFALAWRRLVVPLLRNSGRS
ncbi:MAG: PepSY-associated TM helix domain-containing protein [Gammaproteobacteria bacterium]